MHISDITISAFFNVYKWLYVARFVDLILFLLQLRFKFLNKFKKPTCESGVKLEQHFTCDPHVVKTHVIHMWNTCDFTMGDF